MRSFGSKYFISTNRITQSWSFLVLGSNVTLSFLSFYLFIIIHYYYQQYDFEEKWCTLVLFCNFIPWHRILLWNPLGSNILYQPIGSLNFGVFWVLDSNVTLSFCSFYYYSDFQEFTLESRTQKMSNYVDLEQIFRPKEAHSRVQCQSMKPWNGVEVAPIFPIILMVLTQEKYSSHLRNRNSKPSPKTRFI